MSSTSASALDEALGSFRPSDLTPRLATALIAILPGTQSLPAYGSLAEAAAVLHAGAPDGLVELACEIAATPEIASTLLIANAIDAGDKGITVYTGLKTAASLFFGQSPGFQVDAQQRADGALKGLAVTLLVHRTFPADGVDRVRSFESLPTGVAVLAYFGAVEVALPFAEEVGAGGFVDRLVNGGIGPSGARLSGAVGKEAVAAAQQLLPEVLPALDRWATVGLAHVGPIADTVKPYVPGVLGARESLPDLAATGADTLPIYRYLVARLATEACLMRARLRLDPTYQPLPPLPVEVPAGTVDAAQPATPAVADPFAPATPEAASEPLAGVYVHRIGATELWLVFTEDGRFATSPPLKPGAVIAARPMKPPATYVRTGDSLLVTWPDGRTDDAHIRVFEEGIEIDGREFLRADWELAGSTLDGTYAPLGESGGYRFDSEGRFSSEQGEGTYELGHASLALKWAEGGTEHLSLFTDLYPEPAAPDVIYIGGQRCVKR